MYLKRLTQSAGYLLAFGPALFLLLYASVPSEAQSAGEWLKKGGHYLATCQMTSARRAFQKALQGPALYYNMALTFNKDIREENDSARYWLRQVIRSERSQSLLLARTYALLGDVYRHNNQFDSAAVYLRTSIRMGEKYGYVTPVRLMARLSINTGDMRQASAYAYRALREAEKNNDKELIAYCYLDLGVINQTLNKVKEGDRFLFQAIELEKNKLYSEALSNSYDALATQYSDESVVRKDTALALKAIDLYDKGFAIARRRGEYQQMAYFRMNMAKRYAFLGNLTKATELFADSERLFGRLHDPNEMAAFYLTYGDYLYSYANRKKQGLLLIERAADLWKQTQTSYNQSVAVNALSVGYEEVGAYRKSLQFARAYYELDKKITSENAQKELQALTLKYAIGKKDAQLARQRLELLEKQQLMTLIALVATVVIMLLAVLFALYRYRQHRNLTRLESNFERTAQQLQSFNYSVSHDLRHPLITAQNALTVVRQEPLTTRQAGGLDQVGNSLSNMNAIVEAMLTLAAIERDRLTLSRINTNELIADVLDEQGVTIAVEVPELPELKGDIRLLRQVMVNLISNAVKYTANKPDARITITGKETDKMVEIAVCDTGVGFDNRYNAKLFQLFGRLHPMIPGIGVGLVIVRRIVEKHGGSVMASGEEGQGATFTVCLPK